MIDANGTIREVSIRDMFYTMGLAALDIHAVNLEVAMDDGSRVHIEGFPIGADNEIPVVGSRIEIKVNY